MADQQTGTAGPTSWFQRGKTGLVLFAAGIAGIAAFVANVGGVRTGVMNLFGAGDPGLGLTSARYMTKPSRVSFVINKKYDVAVSNCFVRTDDATIELPQTPPRNATQFPYAIMVQAKPTRTMNLRVQCDGAVTDWVAVKIGS